MAWLELKIDTAPEAIDWANSLLAATHYQGDVSITEYIEPESDEAIEMPDWAYTLRLYIPDDREANRCIQAIDQQLSSLYRTGLTSRLQITDLAEKPTLAES